MDLIKNQDENNDQQIDLDSYSVFKLAEIPKVLDGFPIYQ